MSVRSRKSQIEELEIVVLRTSGNGHATQLMTISPTSGKTYGIKLFPGKLGNLPGLKAECNRVVVNEDQKRVLVIGSCQGNNEYVCKHSLAAVSYRLMLQGKKLYKCNTEADAQRLNHILKGTIIVIASQDGLAYGVVVDRPKLEVKSNGGACSHSERKLEVNSKLMVQVINPAY